MPRKKTPAPAASDVARLKATAAAMLEKLEHMLAGQASDEEYARLFGTKPPLLALDTLTELLLKLQEVEKDAPTATSEGDIGLSPADAALVEDFLKRAREYGEE